MDDCQNAQKGSTQSQAKQTPGSKSQSMSLKRSNKSQATGLGKLLRLCFQFSPTGFWGPEKCWQQIKRRQHAPKTWSRTNFYLPLTFEHDFKKIYVCANSFCARRLWSFWPTTTEKKAKRGCHSVNAPCSMLA